MIVSNEMVKGYHKPYFIPELGEEGLSSYDVAEALQAQHSHVVEKLKRIDINAWRSRGWNIIVSTIKTGERGRPKIIWYFNTAAAKVFVARWENDKGDGYLGFLLGCENIVLDQMPRIKAAYDEAVVRIEELHRENNELRAKQGEPKRLPKRSTVLIPVGYDEIPQLFGPSVRVPRYAKIEPDTLTAEQRRTAKMQHLTRCSEGSIRTLKRLQEEEMIDGMRDRTGAGKAPTAAFS